MTKGEIIKKGISLGVDYSFTHSCYDPVDKENGAYRFVISTPNVEDLGKSVQIGKINVTFRTEEPFTFGSIFNKIKNKFNGLWSR